MVKGESVSGEAWPLFKAGLQRIAEKRDVSIEKAAIIAQEGAQVTGEKEYIQLINDALLTLQQEQQTGTGKNQPQ